MRILLGYSLLKRKTAPPPPIIFPNKNASYFYVLETFFGIKSTKIVCRNFKVCRVGESILGFLLPEKPQI